MPLSAESVSAYLPLMEAIQTQFDSMPEEPPPSAVARIKGSLRNYGATLRTIQAALEQREAKPGDEKDVAWIRTGLGALTEDKWVQDQMAGTVIEAPETAFLQRLNLTPPDGALTYDKAIALLADGLRNLLAS